jgi:hypothetical protein
MKNKDCKENNLGLFIGVGSALGVSMGTAFDNIGLGISLGISFGAGLGIVFWSVIKKKDVEK